MRLMSFKQSNGFSLLELTVSLGVLGVALMFAFPNFQDTITGQRLTTQTNDTLAAILFAKSEALKRRTTVSVCAMKTGVENQCGTNSVEWANGWIVFNDLNGDGVVGVDDEILKYRADYKKTTSAGAITGFVFDGEGIADTSGDIEFCYESANGNKMRRISMTPAGQPSITAHATCT